MNDQYTRMPFGKHEGKPIRDIPEPYLRWVLREIQDLDPWLRRVIGESLESRHREQRGQRQQQDAPPSRTSNDVVLRDDLRNIVRSWYRGLANDYHHDRGVDQQVMQALNVARDRLTLALGID